MCRTWWQNSTYSWSLPPKWQWYPQSLWDLGTAPESPVRLGAPSPPCSLSPLATSSIQPAGAPDSPAARLPRAWPCLTSWPSVLTLDLPLPTPVHPSNGATTQSLGRLLSVLSRPPHTLHQQALPSVPAEQNLTPSLHWSKVSSLPGRLRLRLLKLLVSLKYN